MLELNVLTAEIVDAPVTHHWGPAGQRVSEVRLLCPRLRRKLKIPPCSYCVNGGGMMA
jgi:hypothetical protein